ncbi:hypothetical protein [Cephaloticoccus primus]|nr:hypothetical protein [Cephaloticoccus primus]
MVFRFSNTADCSIKSRALRGQIGAGVGRDPAATRTLAAEKTPLRRQ